MFLEVYPYYDNDLISLEGEVSTFSSKGNIVLIGDFNFRTGQNPDFIEKDSSQINDFDGVDLLPPDYVTDTERVEYILRINIHLGIIRNTFCPILTKVYFVTKWPLLNKLYLS
jgi:hypothetical protein